MASFRRPITLSIPVEVVERFDAVTPQGESRSSWVTKLMEEAIKKNEK